MFAAWSRVRCYKQPAAYAPKVPLNRTYSNARPRTGVPGSEPCHRSWEPYAGSILR